jgi:hypothetical protein
MSDVVDEHPVKCLFGLEKAGDGGEYIKDLSGNASDR